MHMETKDKFCENLKDEILEFIHYLLELLWLSSSRSWYVYVNSMALRPAPEKDIKPGISFAYPETSRQQSTQGAIARKKRPPILRGNYSYTCIESVHSLWRIVIGFIFTSKEVDSAEKRGSSFSSRGAKEANLGVSPLLMGTTSKLNSANGWIYSLR